jgi:hypothetical protein
MYGNDDGVLVLEGFKLSLQSLGHAQTLEDATFRQYQEFRMTTARTI